MEGSRASLMLQGILPSEHLATEQLEEILLEGRVCEIRMLFYVGKDLLRWIEQCVDFVSRERDFHDTGITEQSFAEMLVHDAPFAVADKLRQWGVQDYQSIFTRAIGLNAVFGDAPGRSSLSADFIRNYHQYADSLYATWRSAQSWVKVDPQAFRFDLYASAEYSRLLERQWTEE